MIQAYKKLNACTRTGRVEPALLQRTTEIRTPSRTRKNVAIEVLQQQKTMPSNVMMDNNLFYGEYEIIGNVPIPDEEYDFPINFEDDGFMLYGGPKYFLQWGLIQLGMSEAVIEIGRASCRERV